MRRQPAIPLRSRSGRISSFVSSAVPDPGALPDAPPMDRPNRGGVRSFTGTRRDGAVAPIPAARGTAIEPLESTHSGRSLGSPATTHDAKGFGCRLVVTYPSVLRAGVRKPAGKEPAVGGAGGGRLWRFGGGAARASDALGAGVGGRSTIAAGRGFPLLFSTERFRRDGRHSARVRRRWRNGAAAPEAASSGGWSMR